MPPQQADHLLDFFDGRLNFGAHVMPMKLRRLECPRLM
jgi:hypothetical protein